jgi:kinetochore protein NNF1
MPSTTQSATETPSSPPPQAPTPLTPGPRATAFLNLYNSALDSTLKSISYDSFSSCFPIISTQADAALRGMHAGMISRLGVFAREEFDAIVEERRVVERVNGLEGIIGEARRRKAEGEGKEEVVVA